MNVKRLLPLSLLYEADNHQVQGRTRMQKLVFLAQKRLNDEGLRPYRYIAYDYGPFSKDLLDALEEYDEEGLIDRRIERTWDGSEKYIYQLTGEGKQNFERNLRESPDAEEIEQIRATSSEVIGGFNKMSISKLLDYVYNEYPDYAENSVLS
ncbi:Panacea domain-containing protein [Halorussus salilacus]|uniref:type II toxin-antitoxin system antitoxin SocA domain-containing protein n=1 Tax=Halorussus salilacus TaxID=2953750 RepID=UPI00209EB955|nr:type II toxin-antitoxin system antitoxin SocA domain-containing protein [Halorussus salilacus]USZ67007.1 Panacea domain-containing protein [Halorussus salilacus]